MTNYRIHHQDDGTIVVSDGAGWLPGIYKDARAAAEVLRRCKDANEIVEKFSYLYQADGEGRAITVEDVEEIFNEAANSLTAEEKLAKIEDLMHPGYWGTYDYRRDAILEVLGSKRKEWRGGNPFE